MRETKIFFATDIHGSDRCFRKFVPVVEEGAGRYYAQLFGRKRVVDADGLTGLNKFISDAGFYPQPMTIEEINVLKDDQAGVSDQFRKLISATMTQWLDPLFVDDVLGSSPIVVNPDGRLVELPGGFPMISVGYSNRTPWDSPRELGEEDLAALIDREVAKLADPSRAIFNLHVPPKDTPIDQAVALDHEFRPVMRGGSPYIAGVGSSAVRDAIAMYQPMLSLHGHIHESRGEARIGRSLALNPGSEYSEGVLRGVIITLSEKKGVRGYQLVAG